MKNLKERVASVEQIASSAHKRIDKQDVEIESLRDSRHEHSNIIHNHAGIIAGISNSVDNLIKAVSGLTMQVNKIIWLFGGGMAVGSTLLIVVIYIAKEILKLW